ncbi:MAG TPA: ZIP family metal transporter [Syntrophomonadaceae bacterium]|nr:ZIP family metal transporter [Syntrophomonadaceae bacterium]
MIFDKILLISCAAGICTALGALLLFIKKSWSNRSLAIFLGLASGVMIAVVVFDMLPSAIIFSGYKNAFSGVILGMMLLFIIDKLVLKRFSAGETLVSLGYLIMLGIALHDLPEGMAIALGSEMKSRTGIVIALGIGIHNIPEGMAIAAPLIMAGVSKLKILRQIFLIGLITPLGTIIGKLAVATLPQFLPFLLGLTSGIMIYLVIFQLWPQAGIRDKSIRWLGFWLGVFIMLMATFF